MTWQVHHHRGTAGELHHLDLGQPVRSVHVMDLTTPAVALGSTQSSTVLREPVGMDVTNRHSGGGLVVMVPGEVVWVDVVIPHADPRWSDDVGEAFVWLGEAWADALGDADATVHRGAAVDADLGRIVCFAGVGSGEVLVGDHKVVGMSQRRTRGWARFQCLVHRRFDPERSMGVLAPDVADGEVEERLRARLTHGVGTVTSIDDLAAALVERLADL